MHLAVRAAIVSLLVVEPVAAQQASFDMASALPFDSTITTGTFENGLRYYIRANSRPEARAELRLVVNVGSILENEDQRGLAHLLEHMAFNGTEHFEKQELVSYLESIGMRFGPNVNAFTSFDETVYMLRVPTDSTELIETGFQILEDWAHGMTLDPAEVDAERGVVIEEWRLGRGAAARIRDRQFPVLFSGSRYANRLPIGDVETLRTFEQQALSDFYRTWYRPDLMAVIAVGDFDPSEIEAMIRRHFAGIEAAAADDVDRPMYPVPPHDSTLFSIERDPETTSSRVTVYYKQPQRDHNSYAAYRQGIAERLFTAMLNARLQEIAQQAEPPFMAAFASQGSLARTAEAFSLGAVVQNGGIAAGLETVLTEASRVSEHGFTETELQREKANALRGMERAFAERDKIDSRTLAAEYRRNFLTGEPVPGIEFEWELYQTFVPTITLDEVNRLAHEWIVDESRVVLASSPESDEVAVPTATELATLLREADSVRVEEYQDLAASTPLMNGAPVPGDIVSEDSIPELGVIVWRLSNGAKVLIKPTDFQDDQVVFQSFSPGGTSLVSDSDYIAAATASTVVLQSGVGQLNLIDLQKKLAGKAVQVSPSIGPYSEGIDGFASPADIETMFQLVYLYFTGPREDSTAFLSYKSRLAGFLENRSASPAAAFFDTLQVTLTQGHPRARPFSTALFDEMDMQRSFEFYEDRFADASDFVFAFVGNVDIDSMRTLVRTYIASLPSTGRTEWGVDTGIVPPTGVVDKIVRRGVEPVSQTRIVFTGREADQDRVSRYVLSSMNSVLEIMLRERLREDLGGTYSVSVSGGIQRSPESGYSIAVSYGSDPDRASELSRVVFDEVALLQEEGPSDSVVARVQEIQRRAYETSLRQNQWWASQLVGAERYGSNPMNILHFRELVDDLSPSAVRDAARRYLRDDNYVRVTLLPETVTQ